LGLNDFVLIGSGPASINCALTLRKLKPESKIKVITEAPFILSKMAAPSALRKEIEPSNLIKTPPEGIEFEFNQRIEGVDVEKGVVFSSSKEWKYDKLFVGTGSRHRTVSFENAFYPGDFNSMLRLRELILSEKVKTAVIYGFGMVTLELFDILFSYGIETTVVSSSGYPLSTLVFNELGSKLSGYFERFAKLIFENDIKSYDENYVYMKDGSHIPCDALIVAKGTVASPIISDLEINEFMETQYEGIFSGGDAVKVKDSFTGEFKYIHLNSVAWKTGHYAGLNMAGLKVPFPGDIFFSLTKTKNFSVAVLGELKNFDDVEIMEQGDSLLCRTYRKGKAIGLFALNWEVDFSNFSQFWVNTFI
jgi:NADPH-dependent 2,4-dienoyl-CoA reductase/sulfur reductase-like enzyme